MSFTTERVPGPAETDGQGVYCDLIKDGDRIVEIIEYDALGNVIMRVYGATEEQLNYKGPLP